MYASTSRKRKISEQVVPVIKPLLHHGHNSERHSTNPFDDENYPIPDFNRVYNLMRHTENGLSLADRRWRLLTYPKCFVGSEAVQWMIDNLRIDRKAAVEKGQRLMEAGVIHHVTHSEPFSDKYYFYRFQEDNDSHILNMKRIWDSAIPTRPAVDVAKDLLTRLALLCEEYRKRILDAGSTPQLSSSPPTSSAFPVTPISDPASHIPNSPNLYRSYSSPPLSRPSRSPLLRTPSQRMSAPSTPKLVQNAGLGDDVNYSSLKQSEQFRQFSLASAELQRVQLVALNHYERIAFFVNVYNALCLHGHVVHGPPNSLFRRWVFFRALSYRVAGLDLTLDDIEHGILRGNKRPPFLKFIQQLRPSDPKCQHVLTQRDARIHFVISAGTRSDPPIRILDGENIQEELHHATYEFLSYTVKVDAEKRCVALPRIFYWYAEDFPTPEKNLLLWVAKYLPVEVSHQLVSLVESGDALPSISYENFDWSNAEARFNAAVVRRKRRRLEREMSIAGQELDQALERNFQMPPDSGLDQFLSSSSLPTMNVSKQTNGTRDEVGDSRFMAGDQNPLVQEENDALNGTEGVSRQKPEEMPNKVNKNIPSSEGDVSRPGENRNLNSPQEATSTARTND